MMADITDVAQVANEKFEGNPNDCGEFEIDVDGIEEPPENPRRTQNTGRRESVAGRYSARKQASDMKRIIENGSGGRRPSYFSSFVQSGGFSRDVSQGASPQPGEDRKFSLESNEDLPEEEVFYLTSIAQNKVKIAELADRANKLAKRNKLKAYFHKFSFIFLTALNIVLTIMAGIFSYDGYENHVLQYTASTLSFVAAGVAGVIAAFNPSKKATNCKRAEGKLRNIVNKLTTYIVPSIELKTVAGYSAHNDKLIKVYNTYSAKILKIEAKTFGGGEISEISSS
jgi:hypothetical protein